MDDTNKNIEEVENKETDNTEQGEEVTTPPEKSDGNIPDLYLQLTRPGCEIILDDMDIYPRYCSRKSIGKRSGTFYVHDSSIVNDRIRITGNPNYVGKPCSVIGWVNVYEVINVKEISIGDAVLVDGILFKYSNGKGKTIEKNNEVMYVVDLLDDNQFEFNIGVANYKNSTRIGFGNIGCIKRYYN